MQDETQSRGILPALCEQLGVSKLWLVHRLDKVTSGCLLLALTADAASHLSQQFQAKTIDKYYLAISHKKPSKKQGTISGGMRKIRDGKWALTREQENFSITQFFNKGIGDGLRLFILKPYTGRTHQLRVAMKSLGSPILGDTAYTGQSSDRTYLHAYQLAFTYHDEAFQIIAPMTFGELFGDSQLTTYASDFLAPADLPWPPLKIAHHGLDSKT